MFTNRVRGLFVLLFIGVCQSVAQASLITDTVADFSGVQGANGYTYGYFTVQGSPGSFASYTAPEFNGTEWEGPFSSPSQPAIYPRLDAIGGHPISNPNGDGPTDNGTSQGDPVRIFTYSGATTAATLSGDFQDLNTGGGDGQSVAIYRNGTSIFSSTNIPGTLTAYGPISLTLNPGDTIAWEIKPNAGFYYDQTRLTGVINSVPEPASLVLFGLGALGLFVAARRRRLA